MSRPSGKVPSYCHHHASGRAVVRIDKKDHYLGPYGSAESYEKYEQLIAEWRAARVTGQQVGAHQKRHRQSPLKISDVILRYKDFAKTYYVNDDKPSREFGSMREALRPLRELYGSTMANEFGPLALKAMQQHLVSQGLCRNVVNARVKRIRRFFKWAVSEELVSPVVYQGLSTVSSLRYGKTTARETAPVRPVDVAWIEATLPFMSAQVAAMVTLQRLTGMRPCEVTMMRVCDIETAGDIWLYEPAEHKNKWRGHRRVIPLGPKAQEVIKSYLVPARDAFLFSPKAAEEQRNQNRRKQRQSPMTPSQANRKPKSKPKRAKRERYDTDSYRRAIKYAIAKANKGRADGDKIPNWFPLQIRHARATQVRQQFGIEAAQVSLGHAHANVTEVYAERNMKLAAHVAAITG